MQRPVGIGLVVWAAILVGLAAVFPARADQKDPRLDGLFDALKLAATANEADAIEHRIWGIWLVAKDPEVNRLMAEGIAAMQATGYGAALATFTRVVERAPDFAEGWNKRATVFYLIGDYEASVADIERTLALEPRHFGALAGLGLVEVERHRDKPALDAFERALAIHPRMPGPRANAEALRKRIEGEPI